MYYIYTDTSYHSNTTSYHSNSLINVLSTSLIFHMRIITKRYNLKIYIYGTILTCILRYNLNFNYIADYRPE